VVSVLSADPSIRPAAAPAQVDPAPLATGGPVVGAVSLHDRQPGGAAV